MNIFIYKHFNFMLKIINKNINKSIEQGCQIGPRSGSF